MKKTIRAALLATFLIPGGTALNAAAQQTQSRVLAPVRVPAVPAEVNFAGQTYDMDRIDMYERLDRELTANAYTHGTTLLLLKRANRLFPELIPLIRKAGMPEDLVYLACIESTLNPRAFSPAKAAGLWQFTPATAKDYGLEVNEYVDERYDTEKATAAAMRYLKNLKAKYGDWESAFAAYNGGPARITRQLADQGAGSALDLWLAEETQRYMFRILAVKLIMENPRKYGFQLSPEDLYTPMEYDVVEVAGPVDDWAAWAKKNGISYAQLREANMWIRDKSLPNKSGKTYKVRVPKAASLKRSTARQTVYNPAWTQ